MGKLIPIADYVGDPDGDNSAWFRPAEPPDWDPCTGCPIRGACREARECYDDDQVPDVAVRLVEPPDLIA